jgi:hypothetical protein
MDAIRHDLQAQLGDAAMLFTEGTVDFNAVYEDLISMQRYLSEDDYVTLRSKVTEKIFDILKAGTFNDLYGAQRVVELLELNYELPQDLVHFFNYWISMTDIHDWSNLGKHQSPLSDQYNLEAAKSWALEFVNESAISDDMLIKLLNF